MRGFLMTGLLALVLATSASAATNIVLEARGFGSVVDVSVLPDPFILDVILNSDGPMTGCVIRIDGVGTAAAMTQNPYGMWWNYDTDGVPMMNNDAGWSTTDTDVTGKWNAPIALPLDGRATGVGLAQLSTIYKSAPGAVSGLLGWMRISGGSILQTISVSAESSIGDVDGKPIPGVGLGSLVITPEPASALLLLLGVPFLRRRR